MIVDNLTNPGVAPVDGDQIRIVYANGATEQKQYWSPPAPVAPPPVRILQKIDYLKRMTQTERIAIRTAGAGNAVVNDYIELMSAATTINLDDPDTIAGLNDLEAAGILAVGRSAAIRA